MTKLKQSNKKTMSFKKLQASYLASFENKLKESVSFDFSDNRKILEKALIYSVTTPGKRIRPMICMATEKSITGNFNISIPISIAIELIHCYSLIHDDLPAMDNDDFRRGKPTCHKAYGEDMAILAGDVLNTYVFEYLSNQLPNFTSHKKTLFIIKTLANACGINGMAGGQVLDLKSNLTDNATLQELKRIHQLKTGALLKSCFTLVSESLCDDDSITKMMATIGEEFGLLFQIIDDIIDETGNLESIGKSPGKDAMQNKLTYVSLLGLDQARAEAKIHYLKGINLLKELPLETEELMTIFTYIYNKGTEHVS